MADITACEGKDCPFKDKCYRYTCPKNPYRQSYFVEIPFDKDKADCKYFSPNSKVEI